MTSAKPDKTSLRDIISRYDAILLDAYGVLVNYEHAIPHAPEFIAYLRKSGKPFYILTNGSSATPQANALNYQSKGLDIVTQDVISSGSLIMPWTKKHKRENDKFYLLGPKESRGLFPDLAIVKAYDSDFSGLIITNQSGFAFKKRIDWVISALVGKIRRGEKPLLLLANPDLVFPAKNEGYHITSGMMALIIENALESCFGKDAPKFVRLGKPYAPIFEKAVEVAKTRSLVLFGDQIATDVKGARDFGIDSVLMGTGLIDLATLSSEDKKIPTYMLQDLSL